MLPVPPVPSNCVGMAPDGPPTFTFFCGHDESVKQTRSAQSGSTPPPHVSQCASAHEQRWRSTKLSNPPTHSKELTPPTPSVPFRTRDSVPYQSRERTPRPHPTNGITAAPRPLLSGGLILHRGGRGGSEGGCEGLSGFPLILGKVQAPPKRLVRTAGVRAWGWEYRALKALADPVQPPARAVVRAVAGAVALQPPVPERARTTRGPAPVPGRVALAHALPGLWVAIGVRGGVQVPGKALRRVAEDAAVRGVPHRVARARAVPGAAVAATPVAAAHRASGRRGAGRPAVLGRPADVALAHLQTGSRHGFCLYECFGGGGGGQGCIRR